LTKRDFQTDCAVWNKYRQNREVLDEKSASKKADALWAEVCKLATERDAAQAAFNAAVEAHRQANIANDTFSAQRREMKQIVSGNPRLFAPIEKAFDGENVGPELPRTNPIGFIGLGAGSASR
jgi:hypothetical protein